MRNLYEERRKICFRCACIYESANYEFLTCPECGFQVSSRRYDIILNSVREAVDYGYNYRKKYEEDLGKEGKIKVHYWLPPYDEILNFVGVAIVSGIIGNVSSDIVERTIECIKKKLIHKKVNVSDKRITDLLDDPQKMREFTDYIDAFYNSFERVNQDVREAIFEEMVIDKSMPTMDNIIGILYPNVCVEEMKKISPFSQEEIFKGMIEVEKNIKNKQKLKSSLFNGFWDDIE